MYEDYEREDFADYYRAERDYEAHLFEEEWYSTRRNSNDYDYDDFDNYYDEYDEDVMMAMLD